MPGTQKREPATTPSCLALVAKAQPQSTEPPLTFSTSPVMWRAQSEPRKTMAFATSSASAMRCNGIDLLDFVLVSVGAGAEDRIVQLGVNPAGSDTIHANVGRQLDGQRLGKADLPALRSGIVGVARFAALPRGRADDDDRAAALAASAPAPRRGRWSKFRAGCG